ncbi:MAG: glycoside hydrolase, partial [Halanaerobiales bacterium]
LKKREEEGRYIYTLCSEFGDRLDAPLCVEYTNELLVQIKEVMPKVFEKLISDYQRGRLYPLYGHAHHAHVSLLKKEEITQEILWNREYLHQYMKVPYPEYNGLFPPEASFNSDKMKGIADANIDYVIFPHLEPGKVPFEIRGEGDYTYKPFLIEEAGKKIIAFPRNFPISQEIWRPITKMKRDALKSQGYMLGKFPVFNNEYFGEQEDFPITKEAGVSMYVDVLRQELEKVPDSGVLLYIQDLELMDFGDIALDIMEKAWLRVIKEEEEKYNIRFVTPDQYLDQVLAGTGIDSLPRIKFNKICWAPEIRLILRADGHYPPLGVDGVDGYSREKSGIYDHPHIFWKNGSYYCGIFTALLANFNITTEIPVDIGQLGEKKYDLKDENLKTRTVIYLRLMKRACNWGWRPTEGRQKRPCLLGYLLSGILLEMLKGKPRDLVLNRNYKRLDPRNIVGLRETLKVFIGSRVNYLQYGLTEYKEARNEDVSKAIELLDKVAIWEKRAVSATGELYRLNQNGKSALEDLLRGLQDYSQAVYVATDYIQKVWGESPDPEFLVEKMYEYLYQLYPPVFPSLMEEIDTMRDREIEEYFAG